MTRPLYNFLSASACLLAGVTCAFGFGYQRGVSWVIAPLALAVLFGAVYDVKPRRAAWLGFLFGVGFFGMGLNWTHTSLHIYGGLPLAVALAIALSFCLLLALFPACACALGRWCAQGRNAQIALTCVVAAWVLLEYVRSLLFTGFGWLMLGYSQVPQSPLAGYVPIVGVFGTTALCAALAALLTLAIHHAGDQRKAAVPQALAAIILLAGLGLKQVSHTRPLGEPLEVSVLQGAVPQHRLWIRENMLKIPQIYFDLAKRSSGKLLVAPETAFPFRWEDYRGQEQFHQLLKQRDATLLLGSFTRSASSDRSLNAAIVLQAGSEHEPYAKRHLTPYGEYLPFSDFLEPVLRRADIPFSQLEHGTGDGTITLPFVTLGMSICYESLFPNLFSAPPAEVLVNITNDAWFDTSVMPSQHLQIASARALENGRWLVRASNTGPSAVIRPDGRLHRWLALGVRGNIDTSVMRHEGSTPYARFGDWPMLVLSLLALLAWRRRK